MAKVLKAYTVVPPELYVERKADRQVTAILEDMGRPGYVLVARQMGKTNLILNARRVHCRDGDIFAYLDVSNQIPDFRLFLRNIVDIALAQSNALSNQTRKSISENRPGCALLPHKEHEHELAAILNDIPGKLVICLDEIDALSNSQYSDQVFSFIRSIYFSGRANFGCFERLTYLLSGVAEPADIIKNKDVSPFNIGEKIYLEDFTELEQLTFFKGAGLQVTAECAARIYEWTSGHPRMTWDICSKLEDFTNEGAPITREIIDSTIRNLYFSDVDVPPVDHIRRSVMEHQDIRDALIAMHYGRSESISEALRTKLYLIGISQINLANRVISFKNKILEEALSENFLLQQEPNRFYSAMDSAEKFFSEENYSSSLFELKSIASIADEIGKGWLVAYWSARNHFRLGAFENAIKLLSESRGDTEREVLLVDFYLGTAQFRLGEYEKARVAFERLLSSPAVRSDDPGLYFESRVDLAVCYLELKAAPLLQIEAICNEAIAARAEILNARTWEKPSSITVAESYMALARAKKLQGKNDSALVDLESAEAFTQGASRIRVHLLQAEVLGSVKRKAFPIEKCVLLLPTIKHFSISGTVGNDNLEIEAVFEVLSELHRISRFDDLRKILHYVFECGARDLNLIELVTFLGGQALKMGARDLAVIVLDETLYIDKNGGEPAFVRGILNTLITLDQANLGKYAQRFLQTFIDDVEVRPAMRDALPLYTIYVDAFGVRNQGQWQAALQLIEQISSDEVGASDAQRECLAILKEHVSLHNSMSSARNTGNISRARSLIARITQIRKFELPNFPANFARVLQSITNQMVRRQIGDLPQGKGRKLGRNDIVFVNYDGVIQRGKYKKFMQDIQNGVCILVENPGAS